MLAAVVAGFAMLGAHPPPMTVEYAERAAERYRRQEQRALDANYSVWVTCRVVNRRSARCMLRFWFFHPDELADRQNEGIIVRRSETVLDRVGFPVTVEKRTARAH